MAIENYTLANGEKRYKAVAYLEDKTKKSKRGFKTKKEAKKWIAEIQILGAPKPKSELTFEEVVDMYLEYLKPNVKPSTFYTACYEVRSAFKYIPAERLITQITTNDVSVLAQGFAVEYCKSKHRLCRVQAVFNYAELEGIIESSPFRRLRLPKQKKKGAEYPLWSTTDLKNFLEVCKTKPPIVYPAFRMLAYTGMREGELVALKWSDLEGNLLTISRTMTKDYSGCFVMGDDTKTEGSHRVIALDAETLDILNEWRKVCPPGDRMFPRQPTVIYNWMQKILKENPDIPPSTPHKLRHLHCTILLDAQANLKDVQERLGHASAQTTLNVYAHANPNKSIVADIFTNALDSANM